MKKSILIVALAATAFPASAQLWDNGPLATGTVSSLGVTAPSGSQWSELQRVDNVSNGLVSLGVNYTLANPNRLADDFTVTGAGWNITGILVYGTQTGSTTTSTITTGVVQIWNGKPGQAGSVVVAGDLTTNRLQSSTFSNLYRTGRGSSSTTRPLMATTLTLNATLTAGTYWIEYGMTGSLSGSVFSPLVTVPGQLTVPGANSLFFTAGGYVNVMDTNSNLAQDVPFQVLGSPVPEPATLTVLGVAGLALLRRRRRRV